MDNCYNCGTYTSLEEHHALHGTANRKICDKYPEMKFKLCFMCHRGTNGVHGKNGSKLNLKLKKQAQKNFELSHDRKEFINLFGRNYLD